MTYTCIRLHYVHVCTFMMGFTSLDYMYMYMYIFLCTYMYMYMYNNLYMYMYDKLYIYLYTYHVYFISPAVHVHDEMDIIGHDGHIYKGRASKHNLPPITQVCIYYIDD